MTTPERVNPELIKKALLIAKPECFGEIDGAGTVISYEWLSGPAHGSNRLCHGEFNPLTSDSDAMKLERALKDSWQFGKHYEAKIFFAWIEAPGRTGEPMHYIEDPSDTLLLLKCVSAMHNLSLYTIVSQDGVEGLGK